MMKKCIKCNQERDLACFYKKKKNGIELRDMCMFCHKEYSHLPHVKFRKMYHDAKSRCKHDKGYINRFVHFTIEEFEDWGKTSNYISVYNNWVKNDYKMKYTPTIDRINTKDDYKLNNIQILPLHENVKKDSRKNFPEIVGIKNHKAKLTEEDVFQIRALYGKNNNTLKSLAKTYKVSFCNIASIVKRNTWKHI